MFLSDISKLSFLVTFSVFVPLVAASLFDFQGFSVSLYYFVSQLSVLSCSSLFTYPWMSVSF